MSTSCDALSIPTSNVATRGPEASLSARIARGDKRENFRVFGRDVRPYRAVRPHVKASNTGRLHMSTSTDRTAARVGRRRGSATSSTNRPSSERSGWSIQVWRRRPVERSPATARATIRCRATTEHSRPRRQKRRRFTCRSCSAPMKALDRGAVFSLVRIRSACTSDLRSARTPTVS